MADSGAFRMRRSRNHAEGDHSLCIPGRCDALDDLDESLPDDTDCSAGSTGLDASGQGLYDAVAGGKSLGPTTRVMLLEACRIVDRLDRLDRQLNGRDWSRFRRPDGEVVVVHLDRVLAEAREQATALRSLLTDVDRAIAEQSWSPDSGGGMLADLAARAAERRPATAG